LPNPGPAVEIATTCERAHWSQPQMYTGGASIVQRWRPLFPRCRWVCRLKMEVPSGRPVRQKGIGSRVTSFCREILDPEVHSETRLAFRNPPSQITRARRCAAIGHSRHSLSSAANRDARGFRKKPNGNEPFSAAGDHLGASSQRSPDSRTVSPLRFLLSVILMTLRRRSHTLHPCEDATRPPLTPKPQPFHHRCGVRAPPSSRLKKPGNHFAPACKTLPKKP